MHTPGFNSLHCLQFFVRRINQVGFPIFNELIQPYLTADRWNTQAGSEFVLCYRDWFKLRLLNWACFQTFNYCFPSSFMGFAWLTWLVCCFQLFSSSHSSDESSSKYWHSWVHEYSPATTHQNKPPTISSLLIKMNYGGNACLSICF